MDLYSQVARELGLVTSCFMTDERRLKRSHVKENELKKNETSRPASVGSNRAVILHPITDFMFCEHCCADSNTMGYRFTLESAFEP